MTLTDVEGGLPGAQLKEGITPLSPALQLVTRPETADALHNFPHIYNFINTREKGVGDFTSINFEIEDLETAVEEEAAPAQVGPAKQGPAAVHASNGASSLKELILRPLARGGRAPNSKLFLASSHLPAPPPETTPPKISGHDLRAWMSQLSPPLRRLPLNHLYIPGSHDSFSYSLDTDLGVGPDAPPGTARLARLCPCVTLPLVLRWSLTQRASLLHQLNHGVRYFDIRVAVKDDRFYFVHGLFGDELGDLLTQLREWLEEHKGEVVLLDFQHLYEMSEENHRALVLLLKTRLGERLCPAFSSLHHLTLDYLARSKYQALVFYRHQETAEAVSWLWGSTQLPNPWPDTTTLSAMLSYLANQVASRRPDTFFVTQFVLTPTSGFVARNLCGDLEQLAMTANQALPSWLARLPPGPPGPNVVMADFVDQDDWAVVRAVVEANTSSLIHHLSPLPSP